MNMPDVSVVIPCHNAEEWIGRAIDRALAQEGASVEVIVIDDGSTDGSLDAAKVRGDRIRLETGPNRGACAARNRGLELARAPYVMFLDADDHVEGPFLTGALAALRARDADVAFGRICVDVMGERTLHDAPECETASDAIRHLLDRRFVEPCGTVWSTRFIRSIRGWRDGLRRYQDYELTFRALGETPRVATFRDGFGVYNWHWTEGRISLQRDIDTVRDQAKVLRLLGTYLARTDIPVAEREDLLKRRAYRFWRQTSRNPDPAAGSIGRSLYRAFGGRGHIGSPLHVAVSTLIGLRAKQRLMVAARKIL